MNDEKKKSLEAIIANEKYLAEVRRKELIEAHQDVQEAMTLVLDNIEDLPPGLGLIQEGDKIKIAFLLDSGETSSPIATADAVLEANEKPDQETTYLPVFRLLMGAEVPDENHKVERFYSLEEFTRALTEPLLVDLQKLKDLQEILKSRLSPTNSRDAEKSAPGDEAAKTIWKYVGHKGGEKQEGNIKALNADEAREQLRAKGITVFSLNRMN